MPLSDIFQSSYIRLAGTVLGIVFITYLVAGFAAFSTVSANLEERVQANVKLQSLELQDIYEISGSDALANEVDARTHVSDFDDTILWLGSADGRKQAGWPLETREDLTTGDYDGGMVGHDRGDRYHIAVLPLGDMKLIVGQSYEESSAISEGILFVFLSATIVSVLLSAGFALWLATRAQRRIHAIDATLRAVAGGDLDSRIAHGSTSDDLSRLSAKINQALDQLAATVAAIRQVSVDVAHDLKTPVNRLSIRLQSLRDALGDDDGLAGKADAALGDAKRIIQIFDAILRISQIEAGARRAKFQILPLADIAHTLVELYQAVAEDAGQTLVFTPAERDGTDLILGDRELLVQLFANLIENAIRYAGSGAHIELGLHLGADGVSMSVKDDGPGIPDGEHDRVLARFYRLDKARSSDGSGLGLSLVNAIARLHKAEFCLSDAAPGVRASVRFDRYETSLKAQGKIA